MFRGSRRAWLRLGLVALALSLIWMVSTPDAHAQDRANRPWSLRSLFFPGEQMQRKSFEPPDAPQLKAKPAPKKKPKVQIRRDVDPPPVIAEKDPDAKIVLVVGDFLAGALADGLNAVFATTPGIRILDRSNSASGLVRDDHFDWQARIGPLIESEKPDVVVILIGANDRQQILVGAQRKPFRSESWTREYGARSSTMASEIIGVKIPLVWVAAPAFKSLRTTSDMLALNEIYRKAASDAGGEFVDIWDGFVDESGIFVATGADVTGQAVRLRTSDGINFTGAGKRKLAFYVEKPLRKLLDTEGPGGTPMPALTQMLARPSNVPAPAGELPQRTAPMSLNDVSSDGSGELVAPGGGLASTATQFSKIPLPVGLTTSTVSGRADDFSGTPKRQSSAR